MTFTFIPRESANNIDFMAAATASFAEIRRDGDNICRQYSSGSALRSKK
jgi:hypothetical protein